VIGQFVIGENGAGDLSVGQEVSQFLVTEAKMFSKLSAGVTNAKYFDQAARNVACIAEILNRAGVDIASIENLGFFVIAPQSRIEEGVFAGQMNRDGMKKVVQRRVAEYEDETKRQWYDQWFLPVVNKANIRCISWEEILVLVSESDPQYGAKLEDFYAKCLGFNRFVAKRFSG
jgi:hypothetical protein